MRGVLCVLVLMAAAGCAEDGQDQPADAGSLRCVVVDDTIRPLAGVRITDLGTGETQWSNSNGSFDCTPPEEGTVRYRLEKQGYETTEVEWPRDGPSAFAMQSAK